MATRFYVALVKEVLRKDLTVRSDIAQFQSGEYMLVPPLQFRHSLVAAVRALLQQKKTWVGKPKFTEDELVAALEKAFDAEIDKIQDLNKQAL